MRELRKTQIEGRFYLFPIPVVKERKYLIFCSNEAEADRISEAVRKKEITHPDLISEYFLFLTLHSDKQTKIFVINPEKLTLNL